MKKLIRQFWGVIPFAGFLLCDTAALVIQQLADLSLRSIPFQILFWGTIGSLIVLSIWALRKLKSMKKKIILSIVAACAAIPFLLYAFLFSVFAYAPEHVVVRNEIKMVASVKGFTDVTVYYYPYKTPLFYGAKNIGYEYYGNGGYDPFEMGVSPRVWYFYDLEGNLLEKEGSF